MRFLFSEIIQTVDGDYLWNHLWINLTLSASKIILVIKNINFCPYKFKKKKTPIWKSVMEEKMFLHETFADKQVCTASVLITVSLKCWFRFAKSWCSTAGYEITLSYNKLFRNFVLDGRQPSLLWAANNPDRNNIHVSLLYIRAARK